MEKRISRYIICIMALIMLVGIRNTAEATENYLENNKNSVVQVVMVYTTKDDERFIVQSGSGVVVNSNTILTNYHLVHINSKNLKKAQKYILNNSKEAEFSGKDGMRVAMVKEDDVFIYAEITEESQEKDFAILTLEEETNRSPVIFGNSDEAVMAQNVVAVGYPSIKPFSKKGDKLFSIADINLIAGIISEIEPQRMKISGKISSGNSGGALVDAESGEMIGLLTYNTSDDKKECFKAISINEIKYPYLEGTAYSDNTATSTEEMSTEEIPEIQIDKTALSETIGKAMKLDQSAYTNDSYLILLSCLQQAQKIQYDDQATQTEIDDAQKFLQQSMNNLEVIKEINWALIIGIVAIALIMIAIFVIVIIVLKKKKQQKKEKNQFTVLPNNEIPAFEQQNRKDRGVQQTAATQENINQETTLLNMAGMNIDDNNSTTVLNVVPHQTNAYLIRKKIGERKLIDSIEFTVGKDETRVNYLVSDNKAISRCHMKIIKRGMNYFLMDLGSTNYTYLNGERVPENQEYLIKNGDSIKAADEEFILEII